ncbi:unnamed protein product, partial [Arctogadus glacialis]
MRTPCGLTRHEDPGCLYTCLIEPKPPTCPTLLGDVSVVRACVCVRLYEQWSEDYQKAKRISEGVDTWLLTSSPSPGSVTGPVPSPACPVVLLSPGPQTLRAGLGPIVVSAVFATTARRTANVAQEQDDRSAVHELVSHLPLQMLLYFNMFYFPCWWASAVAMLHLK